jgi:hypothetical protein
MDKAVYVEWWDHASYRGWKEPDQEFYPIKVKTLGWLVKEDDEQIVVTHSLVIVEHDSNTGCIDPHVIVKGAVICRYDVDLR